MKRMILLGMVFLGLVACRITNPDAVKTHSNKLDVDDNNTTVEQKSTDYISGSISTDSSPLDNFRQNPKPVYERYIRESFAAKKNTVINFEYELISENEIPNDIWLVFERNNYHQTNPFLSIDEEKALQLLNLLETANVIEIVARDKNGFAQKIKFSDQAFWNNHVRENPTRTNRNMYVPIFTITEYMENSLEFLKISDENPSFPCIHPSQIRLRIEPAGKWGMLFLNNTAKAVTYGCPASIEVIQNKKEIQLRNFRFYKARIVDFIPE